MDTEPTVEGGASADAKLTDRKLIKFGLDTSPRRRPGKRISEVGKALISLSLATPTRTLAGLAHYARTEISTSATALTKKILPAWLPRVISIVLFLPISRAAALLLFLGTWQVVSKYCNGVAGVADEANATIRRTVSDVEKAGESVREAKGLEMQAMQLAAAVANKDDEVSKNTVQTAREVKTEVEEIMKNVALLETKVGNARNLAERAKMVAEEGSLGLAREMVLNAGKLVEKVVQMEKSAREAVEGLKEMLGDLSLGENATC